MAVFRARFVGVVVVLGLLAGCAPAVSAQTPVLTCTPEAGGDPHPCNQYYFDQLQAKNKLYAEAEAVYRKLWAEKERLYRAGGATKLSPVMLETTTGEYQRWALEQLQELRATKATTVGGAYQLAWFKRVPDKSEKGSIVALQTCIDASSVTVGYEGEKAGPGFVNEELGFFVRDTDGLLKITGSAARSGDSGLVTQPDRLSWS